MRSFKRYLPKPIDPDRITLFDWGLRVRIAILISHWKKHGAWPVIVGYEWLAELETL